VSTKPPLWVAAAQALREGRIGPLPRICTRRPESDYEMEPLVADWDGRGLVSDHFTSEAEHP
jgi:hypothetical protein